MGTYFVGSIGGAYLIKKIGMASTKIIGSLAYIIYTLTRLVKFLFLS